VARVARAGGSAWVSIALRIGAVAVALGVLAWIGRTAAAGPTSVSSIAAAEPDASAAPDPSGPVDAGAPQASAVVAAPAIAPPAPPSAGRARASTTDPVFINQANVDELRRLPGVGLKRAEAILVLRQRLGRFQRVEDLLRVKGVGRSAVKKWRPVIRLDSAGAEASTEDGGVRSPEARAAERSAGLR
jgi:competence protein ComEA